MSKKKLILVAPPYVNNKLHLAHMRSTYIPADILARHCRMLSQQVRFVGGADEYGLPILIEAEKTGVAPEKLIDIYYYSHLEDFESLSISFDNFSRTTDPVHKETVYQFYYSSVDAGRIYQKEVLAPYCETCSTFIADRYLKGNCRYCGASSDGDHCTSCGRHLEIAEIVDPTCCKCGCKPVFLKDEHIFYKVADQYDTIAREMATKAAMPEMVRKNVARCQQLMDWDITRDYSWGIPIPGRDGKVFYMIFEAFPNYVTFTRTSPDAGEEFYAAIWAEESDWQHIYFMGRDLEFLHTSIWQVMLKSMAYKRPDAIHGGGLLNYRGSKMSKSKGWMISVSDFTGSFHGDLLRYYLARFADFKDDAEFDWHQFESLLNEEFLALPRYLCAMLDKKVRGEGGKINVVTLFNDVGRHITACRFDKALEAIVCFYRDCAETELSEADGNVVAASLPILLFPFVPRTAEKLWRALCLEGEVRDRGWFPPFQWDLEIRAIGKERAEIAASFPKLDPSAVDRFMLGLPQIMQEPRSCFLATQASSMLATGEQDA